MHPRRDIRKVPVDIRNVRIRLEFTISIQSGTSSRDLEEGLSCNCFN